MINKLVILINANIKELICFYLKIKIYVWIKLMQNIFYLIHFLMKISKNETFDFENIKFCLIYIFNFFILI